MDNKLFETGRNALGFARMATEGLLEDIPEDQYCHQPLEGTNHALWIMGHIAVTDEFFLTELAQPPAAGRPAWKELFFMGSTPKPDITDYPPLSELQAYFKDVRAGVIEWFGSQSEKELLTPLPEKLGAFSAYRAALMSTLACHEMLHAGQLTVVRKHLGLGPKFG
ncbi:MAG: DinB family protein [Planctomycetota bacterium]